MAEVFTLCLSLLIMSSDQNGPEPSRAQREAAALRTLDGEDRSEIIPERGKGGGVDRKSISETPVSETGALHARQPWFYLRLSAYRFFGMSVGA